MVGELVRRDTKLSNRKTEIKTNNIFLKISVEIEIMQGAEENLRILSLIFSEEKKREGN